MGGGKEGAKQDALSGLHGCTESSALGSELVSCCFICYERSIPSNKPEIKKSVPCK